MIPRVFSFPRSGTHFFMATIKRNFYPNTDLSLDGVIGGHWAELVPLPKNDYAALFASHVVPRGGVEWPSIYLYRDGRDVAVSLWRAKSLQHPSWRGLSFSEFLRKPLDWVGTPGQRQRTSGRSVVVSWASHVGRWLSKGTRHHNAPIYVRYEELVLNQEATLDRLAGELKVGPWEWKPVQEKVGIEPHKGIVGGWRDVFSVEDLAYFHAYVPRDFPGLWKE